MRQRCLFAASLDFRGQDSRGDGGVERIDVSAHWNLDYKVGVFKDEFRDAESFATDNQADWRLIIDLIVILLGFAIASDDPIAFFLQGVDGLG